MNEYDWSSELKIHRNRKLHDAEQWRWSKAARPAGARVTWGRIQSLATSAASRAAVAAGQAADAVRAWVAGPSDPREECC